MTIPELWRLGWTAPLFNHLWQSTVVLLVAWLLTLGLRHNPARIRFAIWMLASIKFLVPFALLAGLGARWAQPVTGKSVGSALYTAADEIGQPFQQSIVQAAPIAASAHPAHWLAFAPAVLVGVWLCGCFVVLSIWFVRWRRMARIAADALPLDSGREVESLRRAEKNAGLRSRIPVLRSSRAIEPGVFGIVRPVLLWPAGISVHLDDAQVESIVAHEVEHVRRRDNLTAAIHMLVEAVFWFHPAVRWVGSRLMDEREQACDEKVLELRAGPEAYAESILKVCAFCLEPSAPCVAGVSGSDLKARVLRIMMHRSGVGLSAMRKFALATAGLLAIAVPVGFGMLHAMQAPTQVVHPANSPAPAFDVVSIKPNDDAGNQRIVRRIGMSSAGFTARRATLKDIIGMAYDLRGDDQLIGGPNWMGSEYFDIEAKENEADVKAAEKLSMDQRRNQLSQMLQSMLADRFALKASIETRELPVWALVVAKGGVKMKPVQVDPFPAPGSPPPPGAHLPMLRTSDGHSWTASAFPIGEFTHWLSHFEELGNRAVVDETGLTGNYDFTLSEVSMGSQFKESHDAPQEPAVSIFTALPEQLGLKLEPRKAPVEVVVIEHAERPSPN
jgi:bla regulator protein BlaR1